MPKLIVFGPTGQTGLQIIRVALENHDNEVSIFIRTPSKLPEDLQDKVKCIVGDVMDEEVVIDAIKGQDAVLSALGTGRNLDKQSVISTGVKNIVAGMKVHGVKKLVFVGVSYLLPGYAGGGAWKSVYKNVTADHERVVNFLKEQGDDISWIGIMPPQIVDHPHTGNYVTAVNKLAGGEKVMSGDMAHAMVTLVLNHREFAGNKHKLLGISTLTENGCSK